MKIRRVIPKDKKELAKLIEEMESIDDYLSKKQRIIRAFSNLPKAAMVASERYISQPEYITFVAEEEGVLQGFIAGEIKEKKYRVYNKEGYVELWFVKEAHQGRKVGKTLFDTLVEKFKKKGCTHIGLSTHLENTKAIQIYDHMGFTKRLVTLFKPLQDLS